jgi:RNA polymerase sigma factor (sigma-70 family)
MKLNEAYEAYTKDPDGWAKEDLGVELLVYCNKFFSTHEGTKGRDGEIHDSLGDAILKVWERLSKFDPKKSSFVTFVTLILKNQLADGHKKVKQRQEIILGDEAQVHPHRSIDDKLTMKQAMECLTKQETELLKMKFAGFSNEGIADHFGKTVPWVKTSYFRLTNKMKLFVEKKV